MEISVTRSPSTVHGTFGKLYIDGVYACETLEDPVAEREGVPVEQWKVPGVSAIPRGRYKVVINHSTRFKKELPQLLAVPGFSGVRIHPGDARRDTDGCILVGVTQDGEKLLRSRDAFDDLMSDMRDAIQHGETIWLTIG